MEKRIFFQKYLPRKNYEHDYYYAQIKKTIVWIRSSKYSVQMLF